MESLNGRNKMHPWNNQDRERIDRMIARLAAEKEEKPAHYYHEVNCACTKCMPDVNTLMEDQRDFE